MQLFVFPKESPSGMLVRGGEQTGHRLCKPEYSGPLHGCPSHFAQMQLCKVFKRLPIAWCGDLLDYPLELF